MHAISSNPSSSHAYLAALNQSGSQSSSKPLSTGSAQSSSGSDSVTLSPGARDLIQAGRVAADQKAGTITSDQASQLYSQIASNQKTIAADKAADGGTLSPADSQAVATLQSKNSAAIYSDAHNGATPPSGTPTASPSVLRTLAQTARVGLDQKAGNLTSTQASSLYSQIQSTYQQVLSDQQANGGSLTQAEAQAIDTTQSALSTQINSLANSSAA